MNGTNTTNPRIHFHGTNEPFSKVSVRRDLNLRYKYWIKRLFGRENKELATKPKEKII